MGQCGVQYGDHTLQVLIASMEFVRAHIFGIKDLGASVGATKPQGWHGLYGTAYTPVLVFYQGWFNVEQIHFPSQELKDLDEKARRGERLTAKQIKQLEGFYQRLAKKRERKDIDKQALTNVKAFKKYIIKDKGRGYEAHQWRCLGFNQEITAKMMGIRQPTASCLLCQFDKKHPTLRTGRDKPQKKKYFSYIDLINAAKPRVPEKVQQLSVSEHHGYHIQGKTFYPRLY